MQKTHSKIKTNYFSFLANFLIPIGGVSTDIYLPSLPSMSEHFMVSKALIQLSVSAFVFAMAITQFFAGAVSDALGRKKLLIASCVVQLLCLLGILTTDSIQAILFFRFIQGAAVAFTMVPARAIINDIFTGTRLKKQLSYITISFALSPILAPYFGGYLQHYFGWRANFYFVFIYACISLFLVIFTLPETIPKTSKFSPGLLLKNSKIILSNKYFILLSVFAGSMMAYSSLFALLGPFMIENVLKYTAVTYGHMALCIGTAWFGGNMLNRIFFNIKKRRKIPFLLWFTFIIILLFLVANSNNSFTLFSLVAPIFLMTLASGWIFGASVAEALAIFKELAASSNACFFSIGWTIFGIVSIIATILKAHTLLPMALVFLLINCGALIIYYSILRRD